VKYVKYVIQHFLLHTFPPLPSTNQNKGRKRVKYKKWKIT
jgi:hypothetical protein